MTGSDEGDRWHGVRVAKGEQVMGRYQRGAGPGLCLKGRVPSVGVKDSAKNGEFNGIERGVSSIIRPRDFFKDLNSPKFFQSLFGPKYFLQRRCKIKIRIAAA